MGFFKSLFSRPSRARSGGSQDSKKDPRAEELVRAIFCAVSEANPYGEVAHNLYGGNEEAKQIDELEAMGDRAVQALGRALRTRANPFTAEGMVACLGRIGTDLAANELGRVLAMPDDNTMETMRAYEAAVQALIKIGSPAADAELERARSGPAAAYVKASQRYRER